MEVFSATNELGPITDDHLYINNIIKIPTIDVIHYDPGSSSGTFGEYWHTHDDNMDMIDKSTLTAVGRTVTFTVYKYEAEQTPLSLKIRLSVYLLKSTSLVIMIL